MNLAKESDLFKEALRQPLIKNQNLPILKNEFFEGFSTEEINDYIASGTNIRRLDDLFMMGISDFITIYQIELEDDRLAIHFRYPDEDQMIHETVYYSANDSD
jgi:hypothetical protein